MALPTHASSLNGENNGGRDWKGLEVGQARRCLPYLSRRDFSRDVLDADRGRSRAHPCDDRDDQILDRVCLVEYHACRF